MRIHPAVQVAILRCINLVVCVVLSVQFERLARRAEMYVTHDLIYVGFFIAWILIDRRLKSRNPN